MDHWPTRSGARDESLASRPNLCLCIYVLILAYMHRHPRPVATLVHEIGVYMAANNIGQKEAANRSGIDQSTVSRILKGAIRRHTRALFELCKFARIPAYDEVEADPAENELLVQALRQTWDGSPEHAKALARVIKSLRGLESRRD